MPNSGVCVHSLFGIYYFANVDLAKRKEIGLYIVMKKSDLKNSIGRIRPREQLIKDTVDKVEAYKERKERRFAFLSYSPGMKLASTACAFALVFCIGFAVAKQNLGTPDARTLADLTVVGVSAYGEEHLPSAYESENDCILINGSIESICFVELERADKENGAIRHCKVSITAKDLVEKSDKLSVDLHNTEEEFEADIVFYDADTMNDFFDQSTNDMLLCLVPGDNGSWNIVEFLPAEK